MTENTDSELLARIDERTETMSKRMETFVTQDEFAPVKAVVFGGVALILVGFMAAILYVTGFHSPSP